MSKEHFKGEATYNDLDLDPRIFGRGLVRLVDYPDYTIMCRSFVFGVSRDLGLYIA